MRAESWVFRGCVAALLAVVALAVTGAGAHPPVGHPRVVWAGSGGLFVKSKLGSYCWTQGASGQCADGAYPLKTRGRLPVDQRDRVTLLVPDPARKVRVSLVHVEGEQINYLDWNRQARAAGQGHHRWWFRLPADLGNANVLEIFARYQQGDGDFWAGLDQG